MKLLDDLGLDDLTPSVDAMKDFKTFVGASRAFHFSALVYEDYSVRSLVSKLYDHPTFVKISNRKDRAVTQTINLLQRHHIDISPIDPNVSNFLKMAVPYSTYEIRIAVNFSYKIRSNFPQYNAFELDPSDIGKRCFLYLRRMQTKKNYNLIIDSRLCPFDKKYAHSVSNTNMLRTFDLFFDVYCMYKVQQEDFGKIEEFCQFQENLEHLTK